MQKNDIHVIHTSRVLWFPGCVIFVSVPDTHCLGLLSDWGDCCFRLNGDSWGAVGYCQDEGWAARKTKPSTMKPTTFLKLETELMINQVCLTRPPWELLDWWSKPGAERMAHLGKAWILLLLHLIHLAAPGAFLSPGKNFRNFVNVLFQVEASNWLQTKVIKAKYKVIVGCG